MAVYFFNFGYGQAAFVAGFGTVMAALGTIVGVIVGQLIVF